jgi:predicted HNH restriction endonuclease
MFKVNSWFLNCGVYVLMYGKLILIHVATERNPDLFRVELMQYILSSFESMIDACLLCKIQLERTYGNV